MKERRHSNAIFVTTCYQKINMSTHVSSVHERKKLFKCQICDQRFSEKGNMTKHMATIHGGKKPLKCEVCEKTFLSRVPLTHTCHQFMMARSNSIAIFVATVVFT